MKANYHTHTARCGHASGTDEQYVEAAIGQQFDVLGMSFSPIRGPEGNIEYLAHLSCRAGQSPRPNVAELVRASYESFAKENEPDEK